MTLIDRLSKLEGPDREVDAEIAVLFSGDPEAHVVKPSEGAMFSHKPGWLVTGDNKSHKAPSYTASVDASIALAERVLPDYDFIIGKTNGGLTIHAQVGPNEMEFGATPAIALCIAILRAKEASKP